MGSYATPRNPEGRGGFGDNKENRSPGFADPKNLKNRSSGHWSKEHSPSYQYRRFMKMDANELLTLAKKWHIIKPSPSEIEQGLYKNYEPHTMVEEMALRRVLDANTDLANMREITDRVEGRAIARTETKEVDEFTDYTDEELAKMAGVADDFDPENPS